MFTTVPHHVKPHAHALEWQCSMCGMAVSVCCVVTQLTKRQGPGAHAAMPLGRMEPHLMGCGVIKVARAQLLMHRPKLN